jgi:hypothetical protein
MHHQIKQFLHLIFWRQVALDALSTCQFAQILSPTNLLLSRSQFEQLGSLIASRPRIKDASRFLFIPGPGDPGFYQLLF